jgi:hypothetical protein
MRMRRGLWGNGVIITPPCDFKESSRSYYRVREVTKHEFEVIASGITSITNFDEFFPDITRLLNARKGILQCQSELGSVGLW